MEVEFYSTFFWAAIHYVILYQPAKIANDSFVAGLTDSHRNIPNYALGLRKVCHKYIKIYFEQNNAYRCVIRDRCLEK